MDMSYVVSQTYMNGSRYSITKLTTVITKQDQRRLLPYRNRSLDQVHDTPWRDYTSVAQTKA